MPRDEAPSGIWGMPSDEAPSGIWGMPSDAVGLPSEALRKNAESHKWVFKHHP